VEAHHNPLAVRVNSELTINAGCWYEEKTPDGDTRRVVQPPEILLFDQILDYLSSRAGNTPPAEISCEDEARAVVAVCLRWGSYLAVIADNDKPVYKAPHGRKTSRISDSEMARINIEAPAALERWIEIKRSEPERYRSLVTASRCLPVAAPDLFRRDIKYYALLKTLAYPPTELSLPQGWPNHDSMSEEKWSACHEHPTRVLANALVNFCWRNGPIESVHGNEVIDIEKYPVRILPLLQRRIWLAEEKTLMKVAARRFAGAVEVLNELLEEESGRGYVEKILPFNTSIASMMLVSPSDWSLTEQTRRVVLNGAEPNL
jgi:hypothetical protein